MPPHTFAETFCVENIMIYLYTHNGEVEVSANIHRKSPHHLYNCAHICTLARFEVSAYLCRKTLRYYYNFEHIGRVFFLSLNTGASVDMQKFRVRSFTRMD